MMFRRIDFIKNIFANRFTQFKMKIARSQVVSVKVNSKTLCLQAILVDLKIVYLKAVFPYDLKQKCISAKSFVNLKQKLFNSGTEE